MAVDIFRKSSEVKELEERLSREMQRRKEAERLLEEKSLENYHVKLQIEEASRLLEERNEELTAFNEELQATQDRLSEVNQVLLDSILYSQRIQRAILPEEGELERYFQDSFLIFKPKNIVSGDFYLFDQKDEHLLISLADCTGHGVPGSMMSLVGIKLLNNIIEERGVRQPQAILDQLDLELNKFLNNKAKSTQHYLKDGMDISVLKYDMASKELLFSSAMHTALVIQENKLTELKGDRQTIGFSYFPKSPFKTQKVKLQKGDTIYLYSDGITDQFGGDRQRKFTPKRMREVLMGGYDKPLKEQKQNLLSELGNWQGRYEQTDDITLIGFRI